MVPRDLQYCTSPNPFLIHENALLTSFKVVHGLSVPVGKAGYNLPRTLSSAISTSTVDEPEPVPISNIRHTHSTATPRVDTQVANHRSRKRDNQRGSPNPPLFRIGRSVIRSRSPNKQLGVGSLDEPERPVNLVTHDTVIGGNDREEDSPSPA